MKNPAIRNAVVLLIVFFGFQTSVHAQKYLSDYDSTLFIRDTLRPLAQRFSNISLTGYIQPQFQVAEEKGAESYSGGNFAPNAASRFMLRRARLKVDYMIPTKDKNYPAAVFTFQFDATERGVFARDVFLRLNETKSHNFYLTAGLFARPFGYEVNLSSSFRETPERGRMSQILMPTERDLGAMVSYEPINKKLPFKFDIGLFNGPGLSGTAEFDSYKDVISRLRVKPIELAPSFLMSGGLSLLYGGWMQGTKYRYETETTGNSSRFVVDSSVSNFGAKAPRHYYGADAQLVQKHAWGKTELRVEYWKGTQPGTATSTVNPGTLPTTPTYIRNFDGAFFYLLQNLGSEKWEAMLKYDWYDPNTKIKGSEIGAAGSNFTAADIKYATWGFGLTHHFNPNLKMLLYYDLVKNESTKLSNYESDRKDNVFTCRMQLRF